MRASDRSLCSCLVPCTHQHCTHHKFTSRPNLASPTFSNGLVTMVPATLIIKGIVECMKFVGKDRETAERFHAMSMTTDTITKQTTSGSITRAGAYYRLACSVPEQQQQQQHRPQVGADAHQHHHPHPSHYRERTGDVPPACAPNAQAHACRMERACSAGLSACLHGSPTFLW